MKTILLSLLTLLISMQFSSAQSDKVTNVSRSTSFSLDSAKLSIEYQNNAFQKAFENSDSIGLANLFTADGKMMMSGAPAFTGRAAITSAIAMFMKMNIRREAKTLQVWGSSDMLVEEGTVSAFDQNGTELEHAKYLVVWKKEDGQWKLFRDMWNTDLAPQSTK